MVFSCEITAFSISSNETPLGVKNTLEGEKPTFIPNKTSCIETVSKPEFKVLKYFKTLILFNAFTA